MRIKCRTAIACKTNRKKKSYGSIVCEKTNFDLCPVPPPFVLTFCANTSQIFYKRTQTKENTFIVSQIPVLDSLHIYGQAS